MKYFVIVCVLVSWNAFCQPNREPVPKQFLRGNTLIIAPANFSIDAPNADWRWDLLHPGRPDPSTLGLYVCVGPKEYFIVNINRFQATTITQEFIKGFLSAANDNPDIAKSIQYKFVDVPLKGSVRYTFSKRIQQQVIYTTGYIVATKNALTISAEALSPDESPVFVSFVKSLKLLKGISN